MKTWISIFTIFTSEKVDILSLFTYYRYIFGLPSVIIYLEISLAPTPVVQVQGR